MTRFCFSLLLTTLLALPAAAQQPEQATQQATLAQEPAPKRFIGCRAASLNQLNGEPLYLIDGLICTPAQVRALSPADIEAVTVFRPEQAAGLYGSRAQLGAFLITTRRVAGRKPSTLRFKHQQQLPDQGAPVQP